MESVYVRVDEMNEWVAKYFPNKDIVTISDLIATIEDLDSELDKVKEDFEEYKQNVEDNYEQILYKKQVE